MRTRETMEDSVDWIRRNPGATLAISLAAGAALGALLTNGLLSRGRRTRWDQLADFSQDTWQRMRPGVQSAVANIRDAVQNLVERFR